MAEPDAKKELARETGGSMLRDLKSHHNMFWDSVRDFHLEPLFKRAYADPARKKLIQRWLASSAGKNIIIRQLDFYCDPLLVEIRSEGWTSRVLDGGAEPLAQVELHAIHLALISLSDTLRSFAFGMVRGQFKLPLLFKNPRDHYYAMRIFLGGGK